MPRQALELGEWEPGRLDGVLLSERDLRLVESLGRLRGDAAPLVAQEGSGVRIQARAGVGVVRFDEFDLRINPKLEGNNVGLFRMVEFTSGLRALVPLRGRPALAMEGLSLLDLVISLLCGVAEGLVRGGLRADYVEREENLSAIRGRFLPDRQELERLGLLDRLLCRFDEHEQDIFDNQLVAAALLQGSRIAQDTGLRRRTRSIAAVFEDACDPFAVDPPVDRHRLVYDRLNQHYEPAHQLALLLLENLGPDELLRGGATRSYSFLINMNLLFEQFVTRVLEQILDRDAFTTEAQFRSRSIIWRLDTDESYASLIPDVLVRRRDRPTAQVPVDAKYKLYGTDDTKVDSGDLAQVFLYSYAFAGPDTPSPSGAIVHPTRTSGEPGVLNLEVRRRAGALRRARIRAIGVHIPTLLDELEQGGGAALNILRDTLTDLVPEPMSAA